MNTTQAAVINCGQTKVKFDRSSLLSIKNTMQNKIKRSVRKRLFNLRIWNFNRISSKPKAIPKLRKPLQPLFPTILCGNLRSIRNKLDETITAINLNNCDLNVFTESWLNSDIPNTCLNINDYKILRLDRVGRGRGGVVAFLKNGIDHIMINQENPLNLEILSFYLTNSKLLVICIYHPYWNEEEMHQVTVDFLFSIVFETRSKFENFSYNIICLGDFNGLRHKIDSFCKGFKLKNVVNFNTRGNAILDCCFTNNPQLYKTEKLAPLGKSDHCLFKCTLQKKKQKHIKYKTVPDYSPSNREKFFFEMENSNFYFDDLIQNSSDLEYCFDLFISKLDSLHSHCFPLRKVKILDNNLPWITDSIRHCIRKRDNAYRKGNILLFKHYRAKVKDMISTSKKNFISDVSKLSSKEDWSKIKNASLFSNKSKGEPCVCEPNQLLQFFTSTTINDDHIIHDISGLSSDQIEITEEYLLEVVNKLRKAGGIPYLNSWIIVKFFEQLKQPLLKLYNACLTLNYVPLSMKSAYITPVPKVKSPKVVSDYRPISPLLKILEIIIYDNPFDH